MGSNWDKASHLAIGSFHFLPASPLHNLRSFRSSVFGISTSPHRREMDESSGMYTYIARWYSIYSSAELWVPLLELLANYSLLSCGSQLGQGLIMQPLAGLDFLPAREGKFLQISLASLGATNVLHIVTERMNHQVCIHILPVCYLQLC